MNRLKCFLVLALLWVIPPFVQAAQTWKFAVQIHATVQTNPPQILLSWRADPEGANSYTVYRKTKNAVSWGSGVTLPGSATNYLDTTVAVGSAYEYRIVKAASGYHGYGYIYAGINTPLIENRGKLILVIATNSTVGLSNELARLQSDLVGDGWTVLRRNVSSNDSPSYVRSLIVADYYADPANVNCVFLFGHVPVLLSGNLDYDGHQSRPMPADAYYGDVDGDWSGSPNYLPSDVELMVGRVDFFNMPGVGSPVQWPGETELLRNYLNKDHAWRHKLVTVPRRALMGDRREDEEGQATSASGYRNFEPLVGPGNTIEANVKDNAPIAERWGPRLAAESYLWAYGCGGGLPTGITFLGTHSAANQYNELWSMDVVNQGAKAVFVMLFGSWFGNWDRQDNFMRAFLATPSAGLTCSMAGRPHWFVHHMGLGEPIGYSTRLSMNNSTLYENEVNDETRAIYIALMGDPALRQDIVAPPGPLTAWSNPDSVSLQWPASSDDVIGYHVYRSLSANGPFTRLTTSPVAETRFTDSDAGSAIWTYMIRAVKLETTPSGTFFNASQGVFATARPVPTIRVTAGITNSGILVSWNSEPTTVYHVLVASNLIQADWTDASGPIEAEAFTTSWLDTNIAANPQRFYCVMAEQSASTGPPAATIWMDDSLPAGANAAGDGGDFWNWSGDNPAPFSGAVAARSSIAPDLHQLYFTDAVAPLTVNSNDLLFAYVYLSPTDTPSEIMLQWNNGTWDHRAYWGADRISYGTPNTASRRYMGPLPPAGQWTKLSVPASLVGLEGSAVSGMSFSLYGGQAAWDCIGTESGE